MLLLEELMRYQPYNEQEARDRVMILDFLKNHDDAFFRTNLVAHITASGWVINGNGTRVLMAYHKIYDSWSWTGGHADGEEDLLHVAIREAREETGLKTVVPVMEAPFSVEVLTVNGHEKKGIYVPSHLHLNVTYLLRGDEREPLSVKEDENRGVAWFTPEEALAKCTERWMAERVYSKLIEKCRKILS